MRVWIICFMKCGEKSLSESALRTGFSAYSTEILLGRVDGEIGSHFFR